MKESLDSYRGSHLSDDSATSLTAQVILDKCIVQDIFSLGIDQLGIERQVRNGEVSVPRFHFPYRFYGLPCGVGSIATR